MASRSSEQVEAIKAARAASSSALALHAPAKIADPNKKQPKPTLSQKFSSKSKSQPQKEKEGESDSEGDHDRHSERHHSGDHHRERDCSDYRCEQKDYRSSGDEYDDESDMEWVQVKRKNRSRR